MRGAFNSMDYLEYLTYAGQGLHDTYDHQFRKDAPVLTTTTGVRNATFGAKAWYQVNTSANTLGALPKFMHIRDGWRIISAQAGTTADGGVAENGAIPATIKPTYVEVSTKAKIIAHGFDVSELHEFNASQTQNDDFASIANLREQLAIKHKVAWDEQLLRDVDSTADTRFESIDRVCSSSTEVTNNSLGAGDADIYGLDRDSTANTSNDAVVNDNAGTDRILTDKLIRSQLDNQREAGGFPNLLITGTDTYAAVQGLYDSQVRYNPLGEAKASVGVNGIDTMEGIGVGIDVATVYGLPLVQDNKVTKDTISRFYFLDTSDAEGFGEPRLGLRIAKPTQYFESGPDTSDRNVFAVNRFGNEGVFRSMGELICHSLFSQGKIRDLKAGT